MDDDPFDSHLFKVWTLKVIAANLIRNNIIWTTLSGHVSLVIFIYNYNKRFKYILIKHKMI